MLFKRSTIGSARPETWIYNVGSDILRSENQHRARSLFAEFGELSFLAMFLQLNDFFLVMKACKTRSTRATIAHLRINVIRTICSTLNIDFFLFFPQSVIRFG